MEFLTNALSSVAVITIILGIFARIVPNTKLRTWGVQLGTVVTGFGSGKLGKASWEKIESFFVNSFGMFFDGFKEGLDSDEQPEE